MAISRESGPSESKVKTTHSTLYRCKQFQYKHQAEIIYDSGHGPGADGRDWVQVAITIPSAPDSPWKVHVERKDLEEIHGD